MKVSQLFVSLTLLHKLLHSFLTLKVVIVAVFKGMSLDDYINR